MIRVLLLEDMELTANQLVKCLQETLPDVVVDSKTTASDAVRIVESSFEKRQCYDVCILDSKIPRVAGDPPEVHPDVCFTISENAPNALIVHLTAFPEDRSVIKQLHEQLGKDIKGRSILIGKNDPNFMEKLLTAIVRFVVERKVDARMKNLFGERSSIGEGAQTRSPATHVAHVTQELAALARDISKHWSCLSETMKTRIKEEFYIDDRKQPVVVSLLDPDADFGSNEVAAAMPVAQPSEHAPEKTCK